MQWLNSTVRSWCVTSTGPHAHEEIEVNGRRGRHVAREKQHLRRPVRVDEGMALVSRGIDRRVEIGGRGPRTGHVCARRDPNGVRARARSVREEIDRAPVVRDRRPLLARRAVELGYWDGVAPGSVSGLGADVDVSAGVHRRRIVVEIELRAAALVVFEVAGSAFEAGRVYPRTEIDGLLPGEVIVYVVSVRSPDITGPRPARPRGGKEEEPVFISWQGRGGVTLNGVHRCA